MKENKQSQSTATSQPETSPDCGPGCDCGPSKQRTRVQWMVSSTVLLAACAVVAIRVASAETAPAKEEKKDFSSAISQLAAKETPKVEPKPAVAPWGTPLKALADLNKLAADVDAAFILLPSEDSEQLTKIQKEVDTAVTTITAKGSKLKKFLMAKDSEDYSRLAKQVGTPSVLAMYKGRGMAAVPGKDMTQAGLMRAFVTASRPASGCCPPGGSKAGCK